MSPRVAALILTHNGGRYLPDLCRSIMNQTHSVDEVVVIDDSSRDDSLEVVSSFGFTAFQGNSDSDDVFTRISSHAYQGLELLTSDYVVLSDQDDVWHADRVAHQVGLLSKHDEWSYLASDGELLGLDAHSSQRTIRSSFPVPENFNGMKPREQFRYALRNSVATAGASIGRVHSLRSLGPIPDGWLHDRWWSLATITQGTFAVDDACVIQYRLHADQEVGLNRGSQGKSSMHAARTMGMSNAWDKLRTIHRELGPLATQSRSGVRVDWPSLLLASIANR